MCVVFYNPNKLLENSSALNSSRSSMASPMPMKCMGVAKFLAMETRTPPLDVPSSLVMTRPLMSTISLKILT